MKANCRRPRHSRRTAAQVTYSDPFPLAQLQSNSFRNSYLVAKPVFAPTAPALPPATAMAMMSPLILKRGDPSRRRDNDYDVLEDGKVVGRIFHLEAAAPEGLALDVGERA